MKIRKSGPRRVKAARDYAIAHHEAAHLVAAITLGLSFVEVTIERRRHAGYGGAVQLTPGQAQTEDVAVACLAGLASQEILMGSQILTVDPARLLGRHDLENVAPLINQLADGDAVKGEELFLHATQRAEDLLRANADLWERLIKALLARRTMSRDEVLIVAKG